MQGRSCRVRVGRSGVETAGATGAHTQRGPGRQPRGRPNACFHLFRSSMCGYPDPFRSVRHLGSVPVGCPLQSGESGSRSSVWLPARLPAGDNGVSSRRRSSLGYERYDVRLHRLVMSLLAALRLGKRLIRRLPAPRRLSCSARSMRVSLTNPFTSADEGSLTTARPWGCCRPVGCAGRELCQQGGLVRRLARWRSWYRLQPD